MSVDSKRFRQVMGTFATGVTVVTAQHEDERRGITVNSFTSVSLDPPLVLVCLDNDSSTLEVIQDAGGYSVNILAKDQQHISDRFAGKWDLRDGHPLDGLPSKPGQFSKAPMFEGALGVLDCLLEQTVVAGDHTILLGQVMDLQMPDPDKEPLLYFGGYRLLAPLDQNGEGEARG